MMYSCCWQEIAASVQFLITVQLELIIMTSGCSNLCDSLSSLSSNSVVKLWAASLWTGTTAWHAPFDWFCSQALSLPLSLLFCRPLPSTGQPHLISWSLSHQNAVQHLVGCLFNAYLSLYISIWLGCWFFLSYIFMEWCLEYYGLCATQLTQFLVGCELRYE